MQRSLAGGIASQDLLPVTEGEQNFKQDNVDELAEELIGRIDFKEGGRKGAPKFPHAQQLPFFDGIPPPHGQ